MKKDAANGGRFRIAMAAALSNVPVGTIRMWERRYGILDPERTPGGGRLYTQADVARLSLLREAVERGHAIGTVAGLSEAALRKRVRGTSLPAMDEACRVLPVGKALAARLEANLQGGEQIELLPALESPEALAALEQAPGADVIVVEAQTLQPQLATLLLQLAREFKPRLLLIEYLVISQSTLRRLDRDGFLLLRGPADAQQLRRLFQLAMHRVPPASPQPPGLLEQLLQQPVPARQFSPRQLGNLATAPSAIRCECPQQLSDLITRLAAFERYSEECMNAAPQDAALHEMLRQATGHARGLVEQTLQMLLRAEEAAR